MKMVRLALFVSVLALFTVAFAQSDNAKVPPRDGCTFDDGRTTCQETTLEVVHGPSGYYLPYKIGVDGGGYCDLDPGPGVTDGTFFALAYWESVYRLTTVDVYYGNSHQLESSVQTERVNVDGSWVVVEIVCRPIPVD